MQPANRYTSVVVAESASGPRVVEAFLNTLDERSFSRHGVRHAGGDELATPAQLAVWLADHGLVAPGTQADAADLTAALALRAALRASLLVRAGQPASAGDLGRVNEVLASFPLRLDLQSDGVLRLSGCAPGAGAAGTASGARAAGAAGVAGVAGAVGTAGAARAAGVRKGAGIAGLVAIAATSAASGSWHRLRICAAPDCRWVFYDTSRSGAGRWCSMATCGNRNKTRRYRERHQAAAGAPRYG